MEELDILIDDLKGTAVELTNRVDELNDYGNTPDANYYAIIPLLDKWAKIKENIAVLLSLKAAILSNKDI